jgi:hypothetical protein
MGQLVWFAPNAAAAAPMCYYSASDHPMSRVGCTGGGADATVLASTNLKSDTCYLVQMAYSGGSPMFPPLVSTAAASSTTCQSWQSQSEANVGAGPTCFTVEGANVNVGTYNNHAVTTDMVHKVSCKQSYISGQSGQSGVTSFKNGSCYLIFTNKELLQTDCKTMMQALAAANATDKTPGKSASDTTDAVRNSAYDSSLNPSQQEAQIQKDCKVSVKNCIQKNPLIQDITAAINLLSALVGVIVIIMIIVGGIQYMTAGGNPQAVAAAKKRITNAVLSIVALIFMFSLLTWLIPGGIF